MEEIIPAATKEKVRFTCTINPLILNNLKIIAHEQNRNTSNLIETILINYVKTYTQEHKQH